MRADQAYDQCVRLTHKQARNFFYGIRLLPFNKRNALSAVYAMARRIDDIGDGELPPEQKLEVLESIRKDLYNLDQSTEDPVLVALIDATQRFELPLNAFDELIDGCRRDVLGFQYTTFDELHHYCRCVAGSIGRLSLAIFGPNNWLEDEPVADALGVALQLTNIIRDVLEDRINGRVYIPSEDLRYFNCTLELDEAGALVDNTDALLSLLEYQIARAEEWYRYGLSLLSSLDYRSRACCAAMAGIYYRLLHRMSLRPGLILYERISLPHWEKMLIATRVAFGGRL